VQWPFLFDYKALGQGLMVGVSGIGKGLRD